MKKILSFAVAAVLLMASCVKESVSLNGNGSEEVKVTFTTELPISVEISRTIADGSQADIVYYAVYENGTCVLTGSKEVSGMVANITDVPLLKNVAYNVAFWAQNESNAPYTFNGENKTVTLNKSKAVANSEALDAFYALVPVTVNGPVTIPVTLTRPLAQINFGTTQEDFEAAERLMGGVGSIINSSVVIEGIGTTFNIFEGKVTAYDDQGVTFTSAAFPKSGEDATLTVNGKTFQRLATAYLLAGGPVDVKLTVSTEDGAKSYSMNEIPAVNVKANHRTNIVGRLLTGNTNFDVNIEEGIDDGFNIEAVVSNATGLKEAVEDAHVTYIKLDSDIDMTKDIVSTLSTRADVANTLITVPAGRKALTIDLGGKTLSWTNKVADVNGDGSLTSKDNVAFFDVRGNLTIKNGTVKFTHAADNIGWNGCSQVFCIATNGVLNVENATIENCGGTDMAYAFDLLGAGSEGITLNVVNSTLKSTYIPVRIFNNGAGMNNVTIKKSTIEGVSRCIWVHVYSSKDNGGKGVKDATLNLDFFNTLDNANGENNTFVNANPARIIEFGFDDEINFNEYGDLYVADGVGKNAEGNYLVYNATGLTWFANEVNKYSNYEYPFKDETIKLVNDIDLGGAEWTPIGDYRFSANRFCGTFDGQDHTISNFKITKKTDKNDSNKSSYGFFGNVEGTVKNLTVKNATVNSYAYTGALVGRLNSGLIENCHAVDCAVSNTYWQGGILIGQINGGTVSGCTVSNSSITSKSAIGALAGPTTAAADVLVKNCTVENCKVIQEGSFGGSYDNYFGSLFGYTEATGDYVININNCKAENTTVKGNTDAPISGDFDGKIYVDGKALVNSADALTAAIADNAVIALAEGTYVIPASAQNKTLKFIGSGDPANTVIATNTSGSYEGCNYNLQGSTVAFENITITTDNKTYTGYAGCNATFKNCVINNSLTLYGNTTFEDCVLNVSGDQYNIWTWSAPNATFNNCVINSDGKAILLYGGANTVLTVNNSTFNDKGGLDELKAAIEIGNDYNTSYEVIVNNTTVNGYAISDKGINTGTTLWANKNSMGKDKLNVVVDGVDVY